tara:strand:+ start:897 stop:998 length:102 start_codon:yes stop_codon:yes gene_type:complete
MSVIGIKNPTQDILIAIQNGGIIIFKDVSVIDA